jgi:hypothetical protein
MPFRHVTSQFYALKAAIEQLLGNDAWLDLKECTSLSTWRAYVLKLLKAVRISIHESVVVRDQAWIGAVNVSIARGEEAAKSSKDIDDILSNFTATLLRQEFLLIGMLPNRRTAHKVTLSRENWRLNGHRSVQYVQSSIQLEAEFWNEQQGRIGFERQMELRNEHRASRSKVPFSQWCHERGV